MRNEIIGIDYKILDYRHRLQESDYRTQIIKIKFHVSDHKNFVVRPIKNLYKTEFQRILKESGKKLTDKFHAL